MTVLFSSAMALAARRLRSLDLFFFLFPLLLPNISEFFGSNLAGNARVDTLGIVTRLLTENHFFGLGAVSLLYDGGLSRIYSRNFFISDVGMVGEIFRVGLFYAAFVYAYAATALQS